MLLKEILPFYIVFRDDSGSIGVIHQNFSGRAKKRAVQPIIFRQC
jgi:hypothetical protein